MLAASTGRRVNIIDRLARTHMLAKEIGPRWMHERRHAPFLKFHMVRCANGAHGKQPCTSKPRKAPLCLLLLQAMGADSVAPRWCVNRPAVVLPVLGLPVSGSGRRPACRDLSSGLGRCTQVSLRCVDWAEPVREVVDR